MIVVLALLALSLAIFGLLSETPEVAVRFWAVAFLVKCVECLIMREGYYQSLTNEENQNDQPS